MRLEAVQYVCRVVSKDNRERVLSDYLLYLKIAVCRVRVEPIRGSLHADGDEQIVEAQRRSSHHSRLFFLQ